MTEGPRELTLPEQMRGPFLREYDPDGGFRHPGAQVASVLFYRSGGHSVVTALGTEHVNRRPLARPFTVCEIARGQHMTTLALQLEASGGATHFDAEVDIRWEVVDFFSAADKRLTDVAASLRPQIQQRLLRISRRFAVRDAQEANRAVEEEREAGGWDDLGRDVGLRIRLYVRIAVDGKERKYANDARDLRAEQEAARLHHEMEKLREQQRSEILQLRMNFFRVLMDGGQWNQVAFMLADDPANSGAFLELLRQETRGDRRELLGHTMRLVEQGVIQSPEVEGQIRALLGGGAVPDTPLTGLTQRPSASPPALDPPHPPHPPGPPRVPHAPVDPPLPDRPPARPRAEEGRPRRRPSDSFDDWDTVAGRTGTRYPAEEGDR